MWQNSNTRHDRFSLFIIFRKKNGKSSLRLCTCGTSLRVACRACARETSVWQHWLAARSLCRRSVRSETRSGRLYVDVHPTKSPDSTTKTSQSLSHLRANIERGCAYRNFRSVKPIYIKENHGWQIRERCGAKVDGDRRNETKVQAQLFWGEGEVNRRDSARTENVR